MPEGMADHQEVGGLIWTCFDRHAAESDTVRKSLQQKRRIYGFTMSAASSPLRDKAPVVWLYWQGADGSHGQTRNAERFRTKWEDLHSIVEDGRIKPVTWLTLSLPDKWPVDEVTLIPKGFQEVSKRSAGPQQLRSPPSLMGTQAERQSCVQPGHPFSRINRGDSVTDDQSEVSPCLSLSAGGDKLGTSWCRHLPVHGCSESCPTMLTMNYVDNQQDFPTVTTKVAEMKTAEDLINMRLIWYQRGKLLGA